MEFSKKIILIFIIFAIPIFVRFLLYMFFVKNEDKILKEGTLYEGDVEKIKYPKTFFYAGLLGLIFPLFLLVFFLFTNDSKFNSEDYIMMPLLILMLSLILGFPLILQINWEIVLKEDELVFKNFLGIKRVYKYSEIRLKEKFNFLFIYANKKLLTIVSTMDVLDVDDISLKLDDYQEKMNLEQAFYSSGAFYISTKKYIAEKSNYVLVGNNIFQSNLNKEDENLFFDKTNNQLCLKFDSKTREMQGVVINIESLKFKKVNYSMKRYFSNKLVYKKNRKNNVYSKLPLKFYVDSEKKLLIIGKLKSEKLIRFNQDTFCVLDINDDIETLIIKVNKEILDNIKTI